jgi:hypothetical protein
MAEELQEKLMDFLMPVPTLTFRAVFEEWKSQLVRCIESGGEQLYKHSFSVI